jgi:hypothetical protein
MVTVLRDGLGAGYNVLPGMTMGQLPSKARALLPSGWADGDGMTSRASAARWRDWPIGAGGPTVVLGCPGTKGGKSREVAP